MAASQPPTENLPAFNSSVFKDANTSSLSLAQAQSLFLARTGNATSVATSTSFNSGGITIASGGLNLSADDITITGGGKISLNSTGIEFDNTGDSLGFGSINLGTNQNACLGSGTSTAGGYGVAIGYVADVQSGTSGCMAIGANSSVNPNLTNAVAFGNNATVTTNNSIVLGTATETIRCPGTASNTSLVATSNITVNGLTVGTSNYPGAVGNTLFGVSAGTAINAATADHNTLIGNTAGAAITGGARNTAVGFASLNAISASTDHTAVGYNALNKCTNIFNAPNTAVGANALAAITGGGLSSAFGFNALAQATGGGNNAFGANAGYATTAGTNNIFFGGDANPPGHSNKANGSNNTFMGHLPTCATSTTANATILGSNCTISGDFGCAIGSGTSAGANQISLGRTNEYVSCNGTNTTNGSLQLAGALRLQTGTYAATPGATMLGYQISLTAVAFTDTQIGTGNCVLGSIVLTSGVWAINYSVELNVNFTLTISEQYYYFSDNNTGGSYPTNAIANTGTVGIFHNISYSGGDLPTISGGGCLYTSSGRTIYPTFALTKTGGAISARGWANATRIG